ncbi:hypothetical protein F2Q69_00020811 [Brassica cretica]|uniref:Uncharacterized protein n=1 Tax=Brassica cretica TaxID=69181 RepID=A0A8S9Q446_BRACR|nr:hypothetical protein F2Q69_00020811 [Brassica cretica]
MTPLPHPLIESPHELCLIIDDKHKNKITEETALKKMESKNIPITTVIKVSKLKTELKKLEKKKKSPVAINLRNGNWKEQVEKVCESALFFVGTGTCSVVKVAKLSMGRKEIVENVVAGRNVVIEQSWGAPESFEFKDKSRTLSSKLILKS